MCLLTLGCYRLFQKEKKKKETKPSILGKNVRAEFISASFSFHVLISHKQHGDLLHWALQSRTEKFS